MLTIIKGERLQLQQAFLNDNVCNIAPILSSLGQSLAIAQRLTGLALG